MRSIERTVSGSESASSAKDSPFSEPVRDAWERAQRLGDRVVGDAGGARGRGRGGGVLAVVHAGDQRLGRQQVVRAELDPVEAEPARNDLHARALEDPELRVAVGIERAVAVEV